MEETSLQQTIYSNKVLLRFLSHIEPGPNGCLEYTSDINKGYGNISIGTRENNRRLLAHRWAFGFCIGGVDLRSDVFICHHCDNPKCVAPDHLFPGDHQANMDDMVSKGRAAVVKNGKLSVEQIKDIKYGEGSLREAAARNGVCKSTASYIRNNKTWPEV